MEHTDALVLRTVDFSESSLVVTLFTREFGKIRGIAKGARRLKNPFESSLDLLARIRVSFLRKNSEGLNILTEAKLQHRFRPTTRNWAGLQAGYYLLELLESMTEDFDPQQRLYDFAVQMSDRFEAGGPVMWPLLRWEWGLLVLIGEQPSIEAHCIECNRSLEFGGKNGEERQENGKSRLPFGLLEGGLLCPSCRVGRQQVLGVSLAALRGLADLVELGNEHWTDVRLERGTLNELRGLTNQYLSAVLGRRPRLHDMLAMIAKSDRQTEPY